MKNDNEMILARMRGIPMKRATPEDISAAKRAGTYPLVDDNVVAIAPPRRNLKALALTIDDVLDMGKEADLEQVLVIGQTRAGEFYIKGAKTGIHQQSRRDIRDLCQEVLDMLMVARVAEETA